MDGRSRNRSSGIAELLLPADVRRRQPPVRTEWGLPRTIALQGGPLSVEDRWHDRPADAPFYSLLRDVVNRRPTHPPQRHGGQPHPDHRGPTIDPSRRLAISGNLPQLGRWNPESALPLDDSSFLLWRATLDLAGRAVRSAEFKIISIGRDASVAWPAGDNLRLPDAPDSDSFSRIVELPLHRPDAALESIGHRRAGIFPAFARRLRHRRLLRPDATGRLGRRHRTEHHTDTPGQRHHKGV